MSRPSRRAIVIAASFALALASIGPSAQADRGGDHDDDTDEQHGGLLDLIDITNLLGGVGLPAVGELPTVEGIGLPALEGLDLPALDEPGIALPPLGLPAFAPPDLSSGPGLGLNVLIQVGLSGSISLL